MKTVRSAGLLLLVAAAAVAGYVGYASKFYYPELEIKGLTKSEALRLIEESAGPLVKLIDNEDGEWYAYKGNQESGREALVQKMAEQGWFFTDQEGSGYFFTGKEGRRIVESELWTSSYILYCIPSGGERQARSGGTQP